MRRVAVLLLLLSACGMTPRVATTHAAAARQAAGNQPAGTAVVSKEVDGDTIHVLINGVDERVRFIGMDTPETHGHGGLVECFGKEGADRTAALIPVGTPVRLVRDVEPRDKYG